MRCSAATFAESLLLLVAGVAALAIHCYKFHRHRPRSTLAAQSRRHMRVAAIFSLVFFVLPIDFRDCVVLVPDMIRRTCAWLCLGGIAAVAVEMVWAAVWAGYAAVKLTNPRGIYRKLMILSSVAWIGAGILRAALEQPYLGDDALSPDRKDTSTRRVQQLMWLYWTVCVAWSLVFGTICCVFLVRVYRILDPHSAAALAKSRKDTKNTTRVIRSRVLKRGIVTGTITLFAVGTATFQLIVVLGDPEARISGSDAESAFLNAQFPAEVLMVAFLVWVLFLVYPSSNSSSTSTTSNFSNNTVQRTASIPSALQMRSMHTHSTPAPHTDADTDADAEAGSRLTVSASTCTESV